LGSGKSTVAAMLRALGAEVVEADALGRALMEPGQAVYAAIVERFGAGVVGADGRLNRARLAEMAFRDGRLQDLNAIVHPAVIEAEQRWMEQVFQRNPAAVAIVESALIFEVERDAIARGESGSVLANWRRRMDRVIVVTAPDELKIARFVARAAAAGVDRESAAADARERMAHQIPDAEKAARADYVLENAGDRQTLQARVEKLWQRLQAERNNPLPAQA
jgi:dephospho-CoA kinase